jgi:L-iditol 2-dehydrogenase
VETAIGAAGRGGVVLLFGFPGHGVTVPVPVDDVVNGDLRIQGSFSYTSAAWAHLVDLINAGALDLGFLVTHRFPLTGWSQAFSVLRGQAAAGPRGKVLLDLRPT